MNEEKEREKVIWKTKEKKMLYKICDFQVTF